MKIIKRDGRAVEYNREKISIAIQKANKEVRQKERATKEQIKDIIKYIEDLGKKRMLVEDIQDIIEQKLMEIEKYELAKKYIVYRYTRALVRKQNTTDESILGLIRNESTELTNNNSNKNVMLASIQRDYIAGEVSRDLTKRILLPDKISKAHEEGILHFHDMDYFVQPIINCCLINIQDMLDNGTVIDGKMIESPKSFHVACSITTQIITSSACNQYGGQSIDLKHLGKYLRKSKDNYLAELEDKYKKKISQDVIEGLVKERIKRELVAGVQIIQYQIMTINGKCPDITLFLNLEEGDPYIEENAMIIEEMLKQRYQGIKNEMGEYVTPSFPKLVYVLNDYNALKGGKYDYLTKLALKCSSKGKSINYISAKKMRENYEGNLFSPMGSRNFLTPWRDENGKYKFEGRFNQGVVSINLPQIAIIADGDKKEFWKLLDSRLELCQEALMCRHYALLGTKSDISPIHWRHGAIARLEKDETIDELLKEGYSTLSLGYIGIYEMTKLMTGESHSSKKGYNFALEVMKHLKETVLKWKLETGLGFVLYGTPTKKISYRFAKIDMEKFGEIKNVTDKGYYTNSYHIDNREEIDPYEKLKIESEFQNLSTGGAISYVEITNTTTSLNKLENLVKFIYDNMQYVEFNFKTDIEK